MPLLSVLVPLLVANTGASPAPDTVMADTRCLAIYAAKVNVNEPNAPVPLGGVMYFTGKLLARDPNIDLASTIRTATTGVGSDSAAETTRCQSELNAVGVKLQAAGDSLTHQ